MRDAPVASLDEGNTGEGTRTAPPLLEWSGADALMPGIA